MLYRIVYISQSLISDDMLTSELSSIRSLATNNNKEKQISGQLIFCHCNFIQILEGMKDDVLELLSSIKQDSRHCNLQVIFSARIGRRRFSDWTQMELVSYDKCLENLSLYLEGLAALPYHSYSLEEVDYIFELIEDIHQVRVKGL